LICDDPRTGRHLSTPTIEKTTNRWKKRSPPIIIRFPNNNCQQISNITLLQFDQVFLCLLNCFCFFCQILMKMKGNFQHKMGKIMGWLLLLCSPNDGHSLTPLSSSLPGKLLGYRLDHLSLPIHLYGITCFFSVSVSLSLSLSLSLSHTHTHTHTHSLSLFLSLSLLIFGCCTPP